MHTSPEQTPQSETKGLIGRLWEHSWVKRLAITSVVGSTALASVVVIGDRLAHRFGEEAGQSAFNAFNSQENHSIGQLENSVPKVVGKRIGNVAICEFAGDFHVTPKTLREDHVSCPPVVAAKQQPGPSHQAAVSAK
jgi:hypothetical protein